ncbi:Modification methylase AplI [Methylobacterium marchantiae]|nr:Modification methylase AplI [Methylobacterium marchantiae]
MIRGLDIFCGAGGGSWGARASGVNFVGAIDMCANATQTYKANFPDTWVVTSRLEDVDVASLVRRLGRVDLLLSSPECTNHTCAKGSAPRDESSRATAMHVVSYARAFRPRWLVLENVVHMRPWTRYEELKSELRSLGYRLAEQILNAADFGVPQSRRRLFLVGDLKGDPKLIDATATHLRPVVANILDQTESWPMTPLRRQGRAQATLDRADRAVAAIGKETPFLIVYYGTDGSGGWQRLTRPLRTITTVDRFALVVPSPDGHRMRMLQVPELSRAMGFDDVFKFNFGTRRDRIRMLGNGICPPVMKAVVGALTGSEGSPAKPRLRVGDMLHDTVQELISESA